MRLLFPLATIFFVSGCMSTNVIDVPSSTEERSTTQILDNKTDALEARDEYRRLQEQRVQE